jgi:glycine dehydrogenase subunit 1
LLDSGILGGLPLGAYYPQRADMENALLLCVTEQRTKGEIDALVAALSRIGAS